MTPPTGADEFSAECASTGRLPDSARIEALVAEAYETYRTNNEGETSRVYPALADAPRDLFGICLVDTAGRVYAKGRHDYAFSITSVSKPFVFALVCQLRGPGEARAKLGANATGRAFNSLAAIEETPEGRTNPMVNAGAITATSLVPGASAEEKWALIHDSLSSFAGRTLALNAEVYASACETNFRTRAIARMLQSLDRIYCDPEEAVDLCTRQCSLNLTARDLAAMGATLADGGVNPISGEKVVDPYVCHYTLAIMATAGFYEHSGDWLYEIGLPGKSGVSGGIVAVSPGKGGIAAFAPLLDALGNSVKGRLATRYLSQRLGMDLFVSCPETSMSGSRHNEQSGLDRDGADQNRPHDGILLPQAGRPPAPSSHVAARRQP
jgi:glutaminase